MMLKKIDRLCGTLMDSVSWFKIGFQAFSVLGMEAFSIVRAERI